MSDRGPAPEFREYFSQIREIPLLTFGEEIELSKRIENGDQAARTRLVEANLRLVVKIAKGYVSTDVGLLDLVQEGNLGLLKAASKYDHRKKVRFSTYAVWWIRQAITRGARRGIRLPHRKEYALRKIQRAYNMLTQRLMRRPSIEEIAEEVGMLSEEVAQIMSSSITPLSLDNPIDTGPDTFYDVYEDRRYSPDTEIMQQVMREETLRILDRLRERERRVLLSRFAFDGGKRRTLQQIGDEMGVSPETVRKTEIRALGNLRPRAWEIEEFVHEGRRLYV